MRAIDLRLQAALPVVAVSATAAGLPHFGVSQSMTVHMATHAVAMNLFAPALCLIMGVRLRERRVLLLASVLQIALLAFWHMPPIIAYTGFIPRVLMHASLICVASVFWGSIAGSDRHHAIEAIAALLLTGKLVCLGGVILIFAPRPLSLGMVHAHAHDIIGDQQLAGLVMLTTCSLTYMSAAIILFWRWLADIRSAAPVRILG